MQLTAAILEEVADEAETDPLELPSLHGSVDADSLERCVESTGPDSRFRFTYYQHFVTVSGTGDVSVTPADDDGVLEAESPGR